MPNIGAPGQEQFRDMIVEFRNRSIIAGMSPLMLLRTEVLASDELARRTGIDQVTVDHWKKHLLHCDRWRRRLTYNPEKVDLGQQIEAAINPNQQIDAGSLPFGSDNVEQGTSSQVKVVWAFDGSDPNIPLSSTLKIPDGSSNALLLIGAIDETLVAWTRLESRHASRSITQMDSMRIYGRYQEILGYFEAFGGDENFIDVAHVLPTDEPRGLAAVPNRVTEQAGTPGIGSTGTTNQPNPST